MTTTPATAPGEIASQAGLGGKPNRKAAFLGVVTRAMEFPVNPGAGCCCTRTLALAGVGSMARRKRASEVWSAARSYEE